MPSKSDHRPAIKRAKTMSFAKASPAKKPDTEKVVKRIVPESVSKPAELVTPTAESKKSAPKPKPTTKVAVAPDPPKKPEPTPKPQAAVAAKAPNCPSATVSVPSVATGAEPATATFNFTVSMTSAKQATAFLTLWNDFNKRSSH